jgi:aspartate aminotransferase
VGDALVPRISERASTVNESTTLAIAAESKRMQAAGIDVVSLSTGEPDFPSPDVVKHAAIAAIESNFTHYTQSNGIPELREAIAEKFRVDNDIRTTASEVLVSCGGKHSIYNALLAICNDGDEVLIPSPYWVSYPEMVRLVGGVPIILESGFDQGYLITPEQIREARTDRTRAIILNSPSNPSGAMYTPEQLQTIGRTAAELGLYVLSDELYEKIVYDGRSHFSMGSMPELADLAITINGVSKAYSMTGWRIGYMTGPADVISAAATMQSQVTSNPSSISQKAALAAITSAGEDVRRMVGTFSNRRDLATSLLRDIPSVRYGKPHGAFYIFLDVHAYYNDRIPDSVALATYLLREHHVAVVPGSAFGDDDAVRLSYACANEQIREGIERIGRGLQAIG